MHIENEKIPDLLSASKLSGSRGVVGGKGVWGKRTYRKKRDGEGLEGEMADRKRNLKHSCQNLDILEMYPKLFDH